jgi:hypothetical protein
VAADAVELPCEFSKPRCQRRSKTDPLAAVEY